MWVFGDQFGSPSSHCRLLRRPGFLTSKAAGMRINIMYEPIKHWNRNITGAEYIMEDLQWGCPLEAAWSRCCLCRSPHLKCQAQQWLHQKPVREALVSHLGWMSIKYTGACIVTMFTVVKICKEIKYTFIWWSIRGCPHRTHSCFLWFYMYTCTRWASLATALSLNTWQVKNSWISINKSQSKFC